MPRRGEITTAKPGERFGRLVVIEASSKSRVLLCDCGNSVNVTRTSQLTSGMTRSCGCLRREIMRDTFIVHGACSPTQNGTAGKRYTRAYSTWRSMIDRCTRSTNPKWARYGGRGITVCQRWLDLFEAFNADMGDPPPGMSLDRIDNDGNYEPGNCRWADVFTQANNRSNNRRHRNVV